MSQCSYHGGPDSFFRSDFDAIIKELPLSQAGEGRHKCPYCAYQLGYSDGLKEVEKKIVEILNQLKALGADIYK